MTLCLLGTVRWQTGGERASPLPVSLPAAILLVLARKGQWMSRSELASLFWPAVSDESALLNLRVNLHKARRLIEEFGIDPPIEGERRRVRWAPPTDLGTGADVKGPVAADFDLPEFEGFAAWLRDWRAEHAGPAMRAAASAASESDADGDAPGAGSSDGFFGRRVELARLRHSNAAAVIVTGEAGIGKSRLVAEAFPGAAWLRCRQGQRQASFAAVAELFASHDAWLRDPGPYRLDIARLLPQVAPDEPLPPLDALTARVRLFEGLARTIERHASLLAVDDLQWADPATLEWLVMLAHRRRVRWIATARTEELPAHVLDAQRALEAAAAAGVVALDGLDRTALNSLLHARRPDLAGEKGFPQNHRWLDALWRYTGGNAFCAIEVMDALAPGDSPQRLAQLPLPQTVAGMLLRRRERLPPKARAVVDAAALAIGRPAAAQLAAMAGLSVAATAAALEAAQTQGVMRGTVCRHDLVREALRDAIAPARAAELHRRAALHLAQAGVEPEAVAYHWRQAGEAESAWSFVLSAAQRMKQRGEREAAVAALTEVRDEAREPALALRAEVMLAQERLFDDLAAGRQALEAALARAGCLPPGGARQEIEANALAGLVDNAVFSGDLARACALAPALRQRLPGLARDVLIEAHQVLIEATMREGDFAAARASLEALRQAQTAQAVVLSFEAQIHWFGGEVRAARQVFEQLLARHPDYCQGLTIENDLAVMCHALGDLGVAEEMARRSLRSWAGTAHTEALSGLVLGATLTSMGRFNEALQALQRAQELGRQQGSALFVSESLSRQARLHWCAGDLAAARRDIVAARAEAGRPAEPLRASAMALTEALTSPGADAAQASAALASLEATAARSRHPLVQARCARAEAALAECRGERAAALAAARRLASVAGATGLAEWSCEALALIARYERGAAAQAARAEALSLAHRRGFGWLVAALEGEPTRLQRGVA